MISYVCFKRKVPRMRPAAKYLIFMYLFLLYAYPLDAYSEPAPSQALALYDQGVSLYKKGDYQGAERSFSDSLRHIQESRCLYYKALAITKQERRSCSEKLVAWQSYLTLCGAGGACEASWQEKAREKSAELSADCGGCSHVAGECPLPAAPTLKGSTQKRAARGAGSATQRAARSVSGDQMRLEASLLCRIKSARGGYEQLKLCHGQYLREDDQIALKVRPAQEGYLYVLIYNDKGQAQLAWPSVGENNRLSPQTSYSLPSPDDDFYKGWWSVDGVKDTKEVISLILSRAPIEDLERMRGLDLSPELSRTFAQRDPVRGRLLTQWTGTDQAQVTGGVVIETVVGGPERVVAQFYFLHE
jgi:hypothetical protein